MHDQGPGSNRELSGCRAALGRLKHWKSVEVVVGNALGLHARAAAMFVRTAQRFQSDIQVERDRTTVNGKSLLGLLTLAAGPGQRLTIRASGLDASQMLQELALLFWRNFDEA